MLEGEATIPEGVEVRVWPVSLKEDQAALFQSNLSWEVPLERLTAFVAFRLSADADVDDVRFVLKLPASGMPEGRVAQVLRGLIDSPEKFLKFLRALLSGLEGLVGWAEAEGAGAWAGDWGEGFDAEPLLEDLIRAAARDPDRLGPIRRLITDLQDSPEGESVVPNDFLEIWDVVDAVVGKEGR